MDLLIRAGKWWCHWDDDMYVNVDRLRELLEKYDWRKEFYVGRASIDYPLQFTYKGWNLLVHTDLYLLKKTNPQQV